MVREVVWVNASKQAEHGGVQERMVVLQTPPRTALASRSYQPSAESQQHEAATPAFAPTGRDTSIWLSATDVRSTLEGLWGKSK